MIDWKELPKYKKSDTGVFLGTGISIRNITDKKFAKLLKSAILYTIKL